MAGETTERIDDSAHFRKVLGHYPTGVSIITALDSDGRLRGMVVGSFTSVSMDPPLVAFYAAHTSRSYAQIKPAGRFCVNVLAADQEPLTRTFASRDVNKFADVDWHAAPSGNPILDDAVAWIDCETDVINSAGDHDIVIGRVIDLDVAAPRPSLLFFQGGYGSFSPHSLMLRDARFATQLQLLDKARPVMEAVAARTGAQVVATHCDGTELTLLASAGTPADPRTTQVAIGQRLPVKPPIGIWWIAFADDAPVNDYLADLQPEIRERCCDALAQIRQRGFAVGSSSVQDQLGDLLERSLTATPTSGGPSIALPPIDFNPDDYNPARVTPDVRVGDTPEIVNLWAPSFDTDGKPSLGFALAGFPIGTRLLSHIEALLEITREVTCLAAP
ncbi:flavin reductase [Mycobacterium sp.]|uniref:flavin reductase n=1 Tax=Mycobacterium sp. TaxID=1785 RepID=UPI003D0E6AC5